MEASFAVFVITSLFVVNVTSRCSSRKASLSYVSTLFTHLYRMKTRRSKVTVKYDTALTFPILIWMLWSIFEYVELMMISGFLWASDETPIYELNFAWNTRIKSLREIITNVCIHTIVIFYFLLNSQLMCALYCFWSSTECSKFQCAPAQLETISEMNLDCGTKDIV